MTSASEGGARSSVAAGVLAGLAVAVVTLPAGGDTLAAYYGPRVLLFYPLIAALLVVWLIGERPSLQGLQLDFLDFALLAFALWQVIAAVGAPVAMLAWFGAYNRIGGAILWLALIALVFVSRRTLHGRHAIEPFVWIVSTVVVVAVGVAACQAAGVATPWPYVSIWFGRVPGTTGNPLNLAPLCLAGVWLAVLACLSDLPRRTRIVAAIAALAAGAGAILAVSRAADLGVIVAGLLLVGCASAARRRRLAVAVVTALLLMSCAAWIYHPGPSGQGSLSARVSLNPKAQTYGLESSDGSRGTFWRIGLKAVAAHPLLGYGPGAYVVAYRRFVPAATLQADPSSAVTDPHSLLLLLAVGSGLPGFALGLVCLVLIILRALPLLPGEMEALRLRGTLGCECPVVATLSLLAALLCFLAVSPSDPAALVPLALACGILARPASSKDNVTASAARQARARAIWVVLLVVSCAALIVTGILGVQLNRADIAARAGVLGSDPTQAARAARLMPWVSTYELLAWNADLQAAVSAGDSKSMAEAGVPYVDRGLQDDASDPQLRSELVRYDLMVDNAPAAAAELRAGLRYNPSSPLLQALLGYVAQTIAHDPRRRGLGVSLARELQALPDKDADGWYWLSVADSALGDHAAASSALARAHAIAPALSPQDYGNRLSGSL